MTKANPNNESETKSEIFFHRTYIFLSKSIKVFQRLLKSIFFSFMTKLNTNNGRETKSHMGHIQI